MKFSRITGPRVSAPLSPLDPRTNAWRPDLADIRLAGLVAVSSYAEPRMMKATRPVALLIADDPVATAVSELLPGEGFALLDSGHGFGWGYSVADQYVGHVALDALAPVETHGGDEAVIGPADALIFREASIKSTTLGWLPMGSRMGVESVSDRFVRICEGPHAGAFLHTRHLLGNGPRPDWVDIAQRFLGTPYRWGGRTRAGIDCSGLVQIARQITGFDCRRDSDMQAADSRPIEGAPERGDVACWPGHIGILIDSSTLLHANAHHMACVVEPLADVIERAATPDQDGVPSVRRF